jgi:peptidyl-prolyl cis-trans isomerase D
MVQQPLIEVSAQLKDEIAIVRAKADATRLRDDIENQRRAGKSLTEIAASDHLATKVIDAIDAQGLSPAHKPVEGIVDGPAVLKAAFDSDIGADTDMITTDNGGYVWYEVAAIDKARQLSLADVHPQVEAAWRTAETIKRLTVKSDAIVKAINGGEALTAIATKEGNLKVLHNGDMRRGGAPVLAKNVGAAVFSVAVHKAGSAAASDGGRIVFQVQSALVPPVSAAGPDFSQLIAKVKEGYLDDTLGQYLTRLEQTFGVKINGKALANAVGDSSGESGGS